MTYQDTCDFPIHSTALFKTQQKYIWDWKLVQAEDSQNYYDQKAFL